MTAMRTGPGAMLVAMWGEGEGLMEGHTFVVGWEVCHSGDVLNEVISLSQSLESSLVDGSTA